MTNLSKLPFLKWVSSKLVTCQRNRLLPRGSSLLEAFICNNPRFYGSTTANGQVKGFGGLNKAKSNKFSYASRRQAQAALLDYLHVTRSLRFCDAENMSKNAPHFLSKLLERVDIEEEGVGKSVTRFLRYHPINEFEPFFESLGVEPPEITRILPRDLMFLNDDERMLENYYVFCDNGIPRNKIGKMYEKARDVFCFDRGVLGSKLQDFRELGVSWSFIPQLIACSPYLLTERVYGDFVKVLDILTNLGIKIVWFEEQLTGYNFYNWVQMLDLLNLLMKNGYTDEQVGRLIRQHPAILCQHNITLLLIGLLLKFGLCMSQICSMFLQFPKMLVGEFIHNLRICTLLFNEIDMEVGSIGKLFQSHALMLGSIKSKKANSLLSSLNVGKKRLCQIILGNPQILKKWAWGAKVEQLPDMGEDDQSRMMKIKFLLDIGFEESSPEMKKAHKWCRGKGAHLQERYDCLVKAGLSRKDVTEMVKVSPQILNQKKNVLEEKINVLVQDLGHPLSVLTVFPSYLCYTPERARLRISMYDWLTSKGAADPTLSLSTVVACSEQTFVKRYVQQHPGGQEVWENLKRRFYPD